MSAAKKIYRTFQSSDGRVKLVTLSGIGLLAAALVLVLAVLPASAGNGSATTTHDVQPQEVSYGGGSGACDATISGRLPSDAEEELHINNPGDDVYTETVDGVDVDIELTGISASGDKKFNFEVLTPGWTVFDVVVNGGAKNAHFDYDDHLGPGGEAFPGPKRIDTGLHAPTKGNSNNLYQLSHINICFDEIPEAPISGTVFIDDDVDGEFDAGEAPAVNLTVYVISDGTLVDQGTTDENGDYSITVATGTDYLVCLGTKEDLVETAPLTPLNCSGAAGLDLFDSGFDIANLGTEGSAGNDFGIKAEVCGSFFEKEGGVFTQADFEIFEGGNDEAPCQGKAGTVFVAGTGDLVGFPVVGPISGSFAAKGTITKIFDDPATVTPLEYKQDIDDDFEDVPFCALRAKVTSGPNPDGNQFFGLVPLGTYPSLVGVFDPDSGDPAVSCLAKKVESLLPAGTGDDDDDVQQVSYLLIQGDPFYG